MVKDVFLHNGGQQNVFMYVAHSNRIFLHNGGQRNAFAYVTRSNRLRYFFNILFLFFFRDHGVRYTYGKFINLMVTNFTCVLHKSRIISINAHPHAHACTHTHTYTHALTHRRTHTHTHTCAPPPHTHTYTHTHTHTPTHTYTHTYTHTHTHTHILTRIYQGGDCTNEECVFPQGGGIFSS